MSRAKEILENVDAIVAFKREQGWLESEEDEANASQIAAEMKSDVIRRQFGRGISEKVPYNIDVKKTLMQPLKTPVQHGHRAQAGMARATADYHQANIDRIRKKKAAKASYKSGGMDKATYKASKKKYGVSGASQLKTVKKALGQHVKHGLGVYQKGDK